MHSTYVLGDLVIFVSMLALVALAVGYAVRALVRPPLGGDEE